jgi:hypothetical protein
VHSCEAKGRYSVTTLCDIPHLQFLELQGKEDFPKRASMTLWEVFESVYIFSSLREGN